MTIHLNVLTFHCYYYSINIQQTGPSWCSHMRICISMVIHDMFQNYMIFISHSYSLASSILAVSKTNAFISCFNLLGSCNSTQFLCKNGRCTNSSNVCNYNNDCGDNSDEFGCRKCGLPNILLEKEAAQMKHALVTIGVIKD